MFVSSKRSMLTSLTAGAILAMLVVNSAFAWDFLGTFVGYQNWSPNSGDKWAQFADDGSWNRYLDAEARYIYYTGSRKAWISQYSGSVAIVFHAFRRDTNCFVNMTGTGYAWSDFPYATVEMKTANCPGENYSGNNEVRIWLNSSYMYPETRYYTGAEYKDRQFESGGARLDGEMNYDSYGLGCQPGCKENMSKFYFNSSNQFQ